MPENIEPVFKKAIDEALKADSFDIEEKEKFKAGVKQAHEYILTWHKRMIRKGKEKDCNEKDLKYGKLVEDFFFFEEMMYEEFYNKVDELDNGDPTDQIKFHFWHAILTEADRESEESKKDFSDNYFSNYPPKGINRGEIFKKTFKAHKVFLTLIANKKYEDYLLDSIKRELKITIDSIKTFEDAIPKPKTDIIVKKDDIKGIKILLLSDLHIRNNSESLNYRSQLEEDLIENLNTNKLNYLVISGDIAIKSINEEYDAAWEFIDKLIIHFELNPDNIIIVPGNHDLNWDLSKNAFKFVLNDLLPKPLPEGKYIPDGNEGALLRNEDDYIKRFSNFASFYEKVHKKKYPFDNSKQGILHIYDKDKIVFLGLNSSWEIDNYNPNRPSINRDALSNALDKLMDTKYKGWLKIAVFHHPIAGPEIMKNVDFIQRLAVRGFKICMHGHIHEAYEGYNKYDKNRGLYIIGAGTFGAPAREQVTGIPLQYNLLTLNSETHTIKVETRKKEKPDGAWSADARYGDMNNPSPRYEISLE